MQGPESLERQATIARLTAERDALIAAVAERRRSLIGVPIVPAPSRLDTVPQQQASHKVPPPRVASVDQDLQRALELSQRGFDNALGQPQPQPLPNSKDTDDIEAEMLRRALVLSLEDSAHIPIPVAGSDLDAPLTWHPSSDLHSSTATSASRAISFGPDVFRGVDPAPKRSKPMPTDCDDWGADVWDIVPPTSLPARGAGIPEQLRVAASEDDDRQYALALQQQMALQPSPRTLKQLDDDHRLAVELHESFKDERAPVQAPVRTSPPQTKPAAVGAGATRRALADARADKQSLAAHEEELLKRAIKASLLDCEPEEMQKILRQLSSAPEDNDNDDVVCTGFSPQQSAEADTLAELLARAIQESEAAGDVDNVSEKVSVPGHMAPILIGRQFGKLHEMEAETGCKISVPRKPASDMIVDTVFTVTGSRTQVTKAMSVFRKVLTQSHKSIGPRAAAAQPSRPQGNVHIFVDFSNILHGAKTVNNTFNINVRLNIAGLVRLVENGRECASRELVGSTMRPEPGWEAPDVLWEVWRRLGYNTHVGWRERGQKESFVDEALHSAIAKRLLADTGAHGPHQQTMVLLTGDGNNDIAGTATFPGLVAAAARHTWRVEVWSWRRALSAEFSRVARAYPGNVFINFLDEHREQITMF